VNEPESPSGAADAADLGDVDAQPAALRPEVTSFEATVSAVEGTAVVLDRSFFYAESGGQPADRGVVGDVSVEHVTHEDGRHVHHLASEPEFAAGDTVSCAVDADFRRYSMRAHTASHVLYGAARRLFDDLGYGGFGIDERKVRVDFTGAAVDDDALVELERLANRAVWEARPVTWEQVPTATAYEREAVAFNEKTEEGVLSAADTVRVVTVEGWDWAACGGTHVSNTEVIGPVTVLHRSNPGEGLTRVEFAVGPTGIEHRATEKGALLETARTAGTAPADLPGEIERLQGELERLEGEVAALREDALGATIADLPVAEREGEGEGGSYTVAAGVVEGMGPNDVEDALRSAAGEHADAVALTGESGSTFLAVAADGEAADAGDLVDRATAEFGGGGGGSPRFAQGGGVQAQPEAVAAFLRGE
jgi:alanyl-tRNA synthetase